MGGSVFAQQTDGRMHSGTGHRFGFAKHAATHFSSQSTDSYLYRDPSYEAGIIGGYRRFELFG